MKAALIYVLLFLLHLTITSTLNSTNTQSLAESQYTRITKRSIRQSKGTKKNVHDSSNTLISDYNLMSNLLQFNYNDNRHPQTEEIRKINGEFALPSESEKVIASNVESGINSMDRLKKYQKFGESYLIRKEPTPEVMLKYASVRHNAD